MNKSEQRSYADKLPIFYVNPCKHCKTDNDRTSYDELSKTYFPLIPANLQINGRTGFPPIRKYVTSLTTQHPLKGSIINSHD